MGTQSKVESYYKTGCRKCIRCEKRKPQSEYLNNGRDTELVDWNGKIQKYYQICQECMDGMLQTFLKEILKPLDND